jgi:hypothetical protein
MSANASDTPVTTPSVAEQTPAVPKAITNAQTVCNQKNEKGKLCNGHLKQLKTAGEAAEVHLRGDDVLFKCQVCGTLYMGPPLGHLRDPEKQHRFVQAELTALLQAAGGTMPVIKRNAQGAYVLAEALADAHAPAKPAAPKTTVPVAPADSSPAADTHRPAAEAQASTGQASAAPLSPAAATASPVAAPETPADLAPDAVAAAVEVQPTAPAADKPKPAPRQAGGPLHRGSYAGFTDTGPVAGETFEQKIARLTQLAAAAKQKSEEGG